MAELSGDQKKKLGVLGCFLGVLVVVGFVAMRQGKKTEEPVTAAKPTVAATSKSSDTKPVGAKPAATVAVKTAATSADGKPKPPGTVVEVKSPLMAPIKYAELKVDDKVVPDGRTDPFEPFYEPTPEPPPTPTPVPPPVQLPPPPSANDSGGNLRFASAPPPSAIRGLPRPFIARYVPLPGPVWNRLTGSPVAPPDPNNVIRSGNKRLSGVIIGDSVRALLEITTDTAAGGVTSGTGDGGGAASNTIVHVVQPGDEVEGIKILRIERVFQDGKQITRMFIKEGEEDRYVDLRNSPTPPAAAGTGGAGSPGIGSGSPITPAPGGGRPNFGGRGNFGRGGITPATPFQ